MKVQAQTVDTQQFFARLSTELEQGPKISLEQARQIRDTLQALSPAQLRKISLPLLEDLGVAKELQPQVIFQLLALRVPSFDPAIAAKSTSEAITKLLQAPPPEKEGGTPYDQAANRDRKEALDRFARDVQLGAQMKDVAPAYELRESCVYPAPDPTGGFRALGEIRDPVAKWSGSFDWMHLENRDGTPPRVTFTYNKYQSSFQLEIGHGTQYSTTLDAATASRLLGLVDAILADPARSDAKARASLEKLKTELETRLGALRGEWAQDFQSVRKALASLAHGVGYVANKQALDEVIEAQSGGKASPAPSIADPVLEKGGYYPGRRLDIHSAADPKNAEKSITLFRDGDSFQICMGEGMRYKKLFGSNLSPEDLDVDTARALLGTITKLIDVEKPPADGALRAALEGRKTTVDYEALVALAKALRVRIDALGGNGVALAALDRLEQGAELKTKSWEKKRAVLKALAADPAITGALAKTGEEAQLGGAGHAADRGHYSLELNLGGKGLNVSGYFMGEEVVHWSGGFISGRTRSGGPIAPRPAVFESGDFAPEKLNAAIWGDLSLETAFAQIREVLAKGVSAG